MYIQKTLKTLLPKDVYLGVEESWKACSETTGVKIDKIVNTNTNSTGTGGAPGQPAEAGPAPPAGNAEGPAQPLNTNTSQEL